MRNGRRGSGKRIAVLHFPLRKLWELRSHRALEDGPVGEVRAAKCAQFDALAKEFMALQKNGGVSLGAFIESRKLRFSVATLCRRVQDYQRRLAEGIEVVPKPPWSVLPARPLGALVALYDVHCDQVRKRRGQITVSAVLAMYRKWCQDSEGWVLEVSDSRLREIVKYRAVAKQTLDKDGGDAYREIAGKVLHTASERMERTQIDATELVGPFLTEDGVVVAKAYLLVVICIATQRIVGWDYYFRQPRAGDAARLVSAIMTGNGRRDAGGYVGPIGRLQSDNGIFRAEGFRGYLKRAGIELEYIEPGKPVQNGAIEKTMGDVKRGIIFDVKKETRWRLEGVTYKDTQCFSEENLKATVRRVVDDLNCGLRRKVSSMAKWDQTPALSSVPRDWAAKAVAGAYFDHFDVKFKGPFVEYDCDRVARSDFNLKDPASRCFVREYFTDHKRPELFVVTNAGFHQSLGGLVPVAHLIPTEAKAKTNPCAPRFPVQALFSFCCKNTSGTGDGEQPRANER